MATTISAAVFAVGLGLADAGRVDDTATADLAEVGADPLPHAVSKSNKIASPAADQPGA